MQGADDRGKEHAVDKPHMVMDGVQVELLDRIPVHLPWSPPDLTPEQPHRPDLKCSPTL